MRYAATLLLLALSTSGFSQSCEPSASTRKVFERLEVPDNERLPAARRQEIRLEVLRVALSTDPADIRLNEAYQATRLAGTETDRAAVIAKYEQAVAKSPRDPIFLYLAANAEIGRKKTNEAIANLNHAIELAPDFGLPHLLLARIYSSGIHDDPARVNRHLERFAALCPASVRTLPSLNWSKDTELIQSEATRLRKNIETRTDSDAMGSYPTLWGLEAALKRSDQQSENQARLRLDINRLSDPEFVRNSAWLSTISQAANFSEDALDGFGGKALHEIATLYPDSGAACREQEQSAKSDIQFPEQGSPEQLAVYWRQTWRALLPVVRKWPASPRLAFEAARAVVEDRTTSPEEIASVIALFQKSIELDPVGFQTSPPASISIAQYLVDRGGPFERVPDLVFAGIAETDRESAAGTSDDLNDLTRASLARRGNLLYLMGYLPLAEAYVRLGKPSRANDALLQADSKLNSLRPAKDASSSENVQFAELAAQYWFERGLEAEMDHRKIDALVDYRNAVGLFPPRRPSPDRRDEVMASAERLWKELGGTTQGWSDWTAQSPLSTFYVGSGETKAWSKLADSSPDLVIKDSLGNSWSPQELAKRTTFITLWASWCGPCPAELPYVEKLYQRFHGSNDVVILAFNVDDDPNAMTRALRELKVSIPSVAARDFAYSVVPEMALPANWIITSRKTEMFQGSDNSHDAWLEEATAAIEKAAGKREQKSQPMPPSVP